MGNMGGHMTRNLVQNGYEVKGFDLSKESLNKAEQNGVIPKTTIAEAVDDVDFVVTCLPRTHDVQKALTDPKEGVFNLAKKGTMICDTSTISPVAAKELSFTAIEHGMRFLDTPMTGGTPAAEAGNLTFMVGSQDQDDFDKAHKFLQGMGQTIIRCGGPGDGGIAKLVNNLILGALMVASSEGLAFGEKLGIDAKTLHKVLLSASSNNICFDKFNPYPGIVDYAPSSRDYQGGFQTALIRKDLQLALDQAADAGCSMKVTEVCRNVF